MMKSRKAQFVFILSLFFLGFIFFVGQKIIEYNDLNKEIIGFLRENNFEEAVNLINYDILSEEDFSYLPIIGQGIELRKRLKRIDNNLEEINNGALLASMFEQDDSSISYYEPKANNKVLAKQGSYLQEIKSDLDYLNRYNIDYIKNQKNRLENWLLFFGYDKPKNYLVLFQEPAIPRPTGGFIGAYAILSFDNGKIEFSGDNIFALEEIFLENIVPPEPLQFISDKWSFHDSNWFFDYPTSAQKILNFYSNTESKPLLDGVILVNSSILNDLLQIIGPITLDNYDSIIDKSNFYSFFKSQIQEMAKPAPTRAQPEFFSSFFQFLETKLRKSSLEILSQIPNILSDGFSKKEIQLYAIDDKLEYFFDSLNWIGRIEESKDDYLGVVFNLFNENFSEDTRDKTVELKTEFISDGQIVNTLVINASVIDRSQETYLKIYLPKGIIIKGAANGYLKNNEDISSYYEKLGYKEDNDLSLIKKTRIKNSSLGIEIYEEGGKTVVGTWTKLSAKPFKLVYKLPFDWTNFSSWQLKIQKQSGHSVEFSYELVMPDDVKIVPTLFPFGELIPLENNMILDFKRG